MDLELRIGCGKQAHVNAFYSVIDSLTLSTGIMVIPPAWMKMWSKLVGDHAILILWNGVMASVEVKNRGLEMCLCGDFFEVGTPFLPIIGLLCVFNFESFSTFKVELLNVYGGEMEMDNRDDWYLIKKMAWRMNLPCQCSQSATFVDQCVSVSTVLEGYTDDNSISLTRNLSKCGCGKN